ncbi:MAG: hypothetical protein SWQ30_22160 [Thermodesulfobacteriota bacterium]|nr:hypothetical protein [Thermodesulfobacteriota bacterium]
MLFFIISLVLVALFLAASVLFGGCLSIAVFKRLVLVPDKVNHEFKYDARLQKKVIEGAYLGKASINGTDYYHLQFDDVLKGENRIIHLYVELPDPDINSKQHLTGFAREEGKEISSDARLALMFYHYHPSYDTEAVLSTVSKQGFSESDLREYPYYLSGWIWDYCGTFICYGPYDWTHVDSWNCEIDVKRRERSKVMPFIRPLYAIPLAVLCLPVDVAGGGFSLLQMLISPRRPGALWYPNLVEELTSPREDLGLP